MGYDTDDEPSMPLDMQLEYVELGVVAQAVAQFILTDTTVSPDINHMAQHILARTHRLCVPEIPLEAALRGHAEWKKRLNIQ